MFKGLRKKIKALKILSKKTKDQEAKKRINDIIAFYKTYWKRREGSDKRKNELLNSVVFRIMELFYKFSINMHLQDTYMHDSKFGDLNEYIKDTFKDIAQQNSSELLFIHSEERFADRTGHTINFDETNKYDKTGKDITPDIFKELNSYKIDNNDIIKSKPTYEDLSKMIEDSEKKKPFKLKEKEQSKNQDMER